MNEADLHAIRRSRGPILPLLMGKPLVLAAVAEVAGANSGRGLATWRDTAI